MAACPVCHSEIEITSQHHGTLYTCPSCNAVFFIDWSGQPEGAPQEDIAAPEFNANDVYNESPDLGFESPIENPMSVEPLTADPMMGEVPAYSSETQDQESQQEEVLQDAEPVDSDYDFSQPLGEPMVSPMQTSVEPSLSSGLSDIADFGNADLGPSTFTYTLTISGIDSGTVRTQVQEALSDSKFAWNVTQVMAQIKGGVLTIKSVNPVKASILMQRVKYLPVKVSWRQDVLSSTI